MTTPSCPWRDSRTRCSWCERHAGGADPPAGTPSTHILKVDNRVHRGTVLLEHDCLQLARRAGVRASDSSLISVGDAPCIVVERYDRVDAGGTPRRVHQEDLCQALGIDVADHDGRAKYESHAGPSLAQVAGLLDAYAADPVTELGHLLERVTFTLVIGDADAHGKNISLLHPDAEHVTLAPLYDTVPTALWPRLRRTAAMHVAGSDRLPDLTGRDLVGEAGRWGLGQTRAQQIVADVCARLQAAATELPWRPGLDLPALVATNLARMHS